MTVDGFYGPETKAAIKASRTASSAASTTGRGAHVVLDDPVLPVTPLRGLELGDSGIRVKTLQRALRADGETLVVDGSFGPQTRAQVEGFQTKCGIKVTGRVNGQTSFFLAGRLQRLTELRGGQER